MRSSNKQAFLALVRAGLWEKEIQLSAFGEIDFSEVYRLAQEQSVSGLVAAGLEHVADVKIPQEIALTFASDVLQLEQRNTAMNNFIGFVVDNMRRAGIYTLLVKGQGIAQCYERPLWRACGDIDFLLSKDNYNKAKDYLLPLASANKKDEKYSKHLGISIDAWYIEIHGTLRTGLSSRVDREIDKVQKCVFYEGGVRSWLNGDTQVFLPSSENDVFFVFTHFLKHFYKGGMNLRQICDWCRLLWTYREKINNSLLEERVRKSGLMPEWKAFATLAVDYLGMPVESMPLYEEKEKWHKKAEKILYLVLFEYTHRVIKDTFVISKIFPWNTYRFLPGILLNVNSLKIKERLFGKDANK